MHFLCPAGSLRVLATAVVSAGLLIVACSSGTQSQTQSGNSAQSTQPQTQPGNSVRSTQVPAQNQPTKMIAQQSSTSAPDTVIPQPTPKTTVQTQLTLPAVTPAPTQTIKKRSPAAVVNGEPITFDELDKLLEQQYGRDTLQALITQKLIDQQAKKEGIKVSDAEITKRMQQSQGAYPNREFARADIELEKLLKPRIKVTQSDLQKYYSSNQQQFSAPQEVELEQVITANASDANKASQALRKGESIDSVVKKYGVKTGASAKQNGRTGFTPIDQLDFAVSPVVAQMAKGDVSPPIQVSGGYEVVRVVDRRGGEVKPFDKVKSQVRDAYVQQQLSQIAGPYLQKLQAKAKIQSQFGPLPTQSPNQPQPVVPTQPPSNNQPAG